MNGRVIFFPLKFVPDEKEQRRLRNIQDELTHTHAHLIMISKNPYELEIRKQNFYKRVRKGLTVISDIEKDIQGI